MSIMAQEERAARAAHAAWPALATRAGLSAVEWRPGPVRVRTVHGQTRVLLPLDGPMPLILKHAPMESAVWLESQITAHRRAEAAFADAAGLHVPRLLAVDRERRAWLLERVPGRTAHDAMAGADGAGRLAILTQAGRWAGHLHRAGPVQFRRIRSRPVLDRIARWREEIEAGSVKPSDTERFDALRVQAMRMVEAAEGVKCTRTQIHGDLNLRNLILDLDHVWGIDFGTTALRNPAVDLARILVRHETFFGPVDGDAVETPEAARAALLAGYGGRWRDTTALDHLIVVDLLRLWMSVPAQPWRRSLTQARRWAGISRMAARLGV
ncbi:MAG: aminoglycoside phosphotransferase family protein [Pseudomonadota bacterium]